MNQTQWGFNNLGQGLSDPSMVRDSSSQDTPTYKIWDAYII